jgi:acetyl esterase
MPLDPQAQAILDQIAEAGLPQSSDLPVDEARRMMIERRKLVNATPDPVGRVENRAIPGPGGEIPVRIYAPSGAGPFPILVYFHGGGWVLGTLDTHDALCRALTNAAECLVMSVEYRLAPEHKFPAAAEDAYAATRWAASNGDALGGDGSRLAVGGDSAGGNLAAAVTLMARDRGGPSLTHQLLIYPVTDRSFETRSYRDNADGYMLSRGDMIWFWDHYLSDEADADNPYASPLRAEDLRGLPSATVITAEYDPLRDEGEAYATRLREAGVSVASTCYPGMIHGFLANLAVIDAGKQAVRASGQALSAAFGTR